MRKSPRLQNLALMIVALLCAVLMTEVVLRSLDRDFDPSPEWHYDPFLGWVQNPGHRYTYTVAGEEVEVAYNSLGFRDVEHALRKPPGVRRVLVIGDSFSAAVEVNLRDSFPQRLERMLNARSLETWEVINLGVGDFGTAQEVLAFEHYGLAYRPDIVLHQIFPLNDICNNSLDLADLCKSRRDSFRPYFVVSGDDLLPVSVQPWRSLLRRNLYTYRLAEQAYFTAVGREESQVDVGEYNRRVAAAGLPPLAPLLYTYVDAGEQIEAVARGWKVTELLIERIAGRCQDLGIGYVPVVIPFHARIGELWERFAETQPPPPMIRSYPERRLGELFERLSLPGVMARDVFERHPDVVLPPRGGHLNPAAHRLVARAIFEKLLETGLATEDPDLFVNLALESPDLAAASETELYQWGTPIEPGSDRRARGYLVSGWGEPEESHVWTVGRSAVIALRVQPSSGPVRMRAQLAAFLVPGKVDRQTVRILVDGEEVGRWEVTSPELHEQTLLIPAARIAGRRRIELTFETPDAASPASAGVSPDVRTLAVALASLTLSEGREEGAPTAFPDRYESGSTALPDLRKAKLVSPS